MASNTTAALRIIFGADTEQLDKALGYLQKKLRDTGKSLTKTGKTMSASLTAPLVAIGAASFHTASQFEASMAKVKAVSGATAEEFGILKKQALELGRTTVFTASNVAELQLEFSKLGFTADQITKVTESTLYLAQATGSDLATSAEVAGATLRGFGLEAESTQRVTDVMAASFSASALDMTSFRESMKYVAPVAKAAGLSIEQATAYLATLANSGIKGSQAGTALRRILSQLAGSGQDAGVEIEKLAKRGLNLADAKDEVGRSAQTALLILSEATGQTKQLSEEFLDAEGSAGAMAEVMNQTSKGALARMTSALEGASIVIGDSLAPLVNRLAKFIEELANGFTDLSPTAQRTIIVLGGIAASIGPLLLLSGQFAFALANLAPAFAYVAAKVALLNAALLANPWILTAAAIGVAVGALYAFRIEGEKTITTQERVNQLRKGAEQSADAEAVKVKALVEQYKEFNEGGIGRKVVLEDLQKIAPEYFGNLDTETTKLADLKTAYEDYNREARAAAVQRVFADRLVEIQAGAIQAEAELSKLGIQVKDFQAGTQLGDVGFMRQFTDADLDAFAEGGGAALATVQRFSESLGFGAEQALTQALALREYGAEIDEVNKQMTALLNSTDTNSAATGEGAKTTTTATRTQLKYKTATDQASKALDSLAKKEAAIQGELFLDGKEAKAAQATADAYHEAAKALAALGETSIAAELEQQADSFDKEALAARRAANAHLQFDSALFNTATVTAGATVAVGDLLGALNRVGTTVTETSTTLDSATQNAQQFAEGALTSVLNFFDTFAQSLSSAVEQAVQMQEPLGSVVDIAAGAAGAVLGTLGNLAIQVGKTAIMTGAAVEGIKEALKTLNPLVAIGAGIALLALAGAVKGRLARAADQPPKLARGGLTTGETIATIGDNPSGKEAIIPFERMGEFLNMVSPAAQQVVVTGRISGQDILLSNTRASQNRTRNAGF